MTPLDPASSATLRRVADAVTFPPGLRRCAVSGGADSLALLALAVYDAPDPSEVVAVHVDHGLRPDSSDDTAVVRTVAERLGAGVETHRVDVPEGANLEARARNARHRVLGAEAVFGHTADDQAETLLLALLRGSGLDGVAEMDPRRHPLLRIRRADTEAICTELGIEPARDPTNDDPRFRRNRIRHEVLPLLDDVADRDVVPLLARLASVAAHDVAHLDALAAEVDPSDALALVASPPPLARRALRRWLRTLHPEAHPPDLAGVERVLAVAAGDAVAAQIPGGWTVRRSGQRLRVEAPTAAAEGEAVAAVGADDEHPGIDG